MEKKEILGLVKKENKIEKLNPVQEMALKMGILEGESLLVSSPTSSGKTLLAEMAGINTTLNKRKKMVYLSPLVALAREKYEDFKRKYEKYGIKIALSVGNYDSDDPWLENFDWILVSNEKMDSLIRHRANWIERVGLIVVDEIHLLDDWERGSTLEILLTILKEILPSAQFLALSATVKNAEEIGKWLQAKILRSSFRPVPLYKGILIGNKIEMFGRENYILNKNSTLEEAVVEDTLLKKKQMIFFMASRKNAEALAERLSQFVFHFLEEKEIKELEKLSQKIEGVLETPTLQCKKLAKVVRGGVAFYHSGILFLQRVLLEEAYKQGLIKVITSTTSLAMGVNLPNFRSVVRDIKRYVPGIGANFLSVLEVEQMFGRSGRPQYDQWGEGILIAKNEEEKEELEDFYINGDLEEIESKLTNESSLRMHLLALVANGFCQKEEVLLDFFQKTFLGKQRRLNFLLKKIEDILFSLENWGFIERGEKLIATKLGKRVAQLYIDPLTACLFIENLKEKEEVEEFPFLCLIAKARELKPSLPLNTKERLIIEEEIIKNQETFFFPFPDELDEEYEEFLKEVKLGKILFLWMEEVSEKELMEKFKITPGELHSKLEISDWLLYALSEIGKILPLTNNLQRKIKKIRSRLKYGIKEELIPLVKLKEIGRKRARILFNGGIKTISQLQKISQKELEKLLKSKKLAEKIKSQL